MTKLEQSKVRINVNGMYYETSDVKTGFCSFHESYTEVPLFDMYANGSGPRDTRYLGLICENCMKRINVLGEK